jgi:CPA1 family monovalent cation:H+ antiporter
MAVAGLLIGNQGVAFAMSDTTRDYLIKFWALVDEVLNAVLFLLIGLEGVALLGETPLLLVGLAAIPLVLLARTLSVGPPLLLWRKSLPLRATMPVLVWGGLRGGISVAMALSLPNGDPKNLLLTATYVVVLFSVLVQGATIARVIPKPAVNRDAEL